MSWNKIYDTILNGIEELPPNRTLQYISGQSYTTLELVDKENRRILATRDNQTVSIPFEHVEQVAKEFARGKVVHFDSLFQGGGNTRAVLETLLAHLPNITWMKIDRKKHLSWSEEELHEIGTLQESDDLPQTITENVQIDLLYPDLYDDLLGARFRVNESVLIRFLSAILSKRFIVLTGLSGSGKTKLAQAFSTWITPQTCSLVIPVGADWIGNENILGYPNGLEPGKYVSQPALELILQAINNPEVPHFLILDEMNLSHVERYFADFLSAIESGASIPLYNGELRTAGSKEIPRELHLPSNLFVIGTVNVDETTYMFSPKVLDRANVIEFRMNEDDIQDFLDFPSAPDMGAVTGCGKEFGFEFVQRAGNKQSQMPAEVQKQFKSEMLLFFNLLQQHDAEFGYRVSYETARFITFYKLLGGYADDNTDWFKDAIDAVIVQKFLPKLHGSRSKLEGLLWGLAWACGVNGDRVSDFPAQLIAASSAQDDKYNPENLEKSLGSNPARYPLSYNKVMRMWRKLIRDQFVTFAEA